MNIEATMAIRSLKRIMQNDINYQTDLGKQVLLLPSNVDIVIDDDQQVETKGLGALDNKKKDLLTHIRIIEPLDLVYENTNVIMPRTYAESLTPIPEHMSVQCLIFANIDRDTANFINETNKKNPYGRVVYDRFVISRNKNIRVNSGDILYIMNRRVGGWDGSIDHPVIELLGAGGHLATYYDSESESFKPVDYLANLQREFREELKIDVKKESFSIFGGFHNKKSNELVVLCGAFINGAEVKSIFENTQKNIKENLAGIYVGYFDEVISMYLEDACPFAGGNAALPTNFPSQEALMKKVAAYLNIHNNK